MERRAHTEPLTRRNGRPTRVVGLDQLPTQRSPRPHRTLVTDPDPPRTTDRQRSNDRSRRPNKRTSRTHDMHRVLSLATPEEIEAMPPGPGSLAGPPIRQQILWSTPDAPPCAPSFAPCDNRTYVTRYGQRQAVDDCGNCPSCRARQQTLDDARKKWEAVNTNQSHG